MASHTTGPWTLGLCTDADQDRLPHEHRTGDKYFVRSCFPLGSDVCLVHHTYKTDSGVSDANARLIAAAPELLDACRQALKVFADLSVALKRATEQQAELVHVGDLYKLTQFYVPVLRGAILKAEGS